MYAQIKLQRFFATAKGVAVVGAAVVAVVGSPVLEKKQSNSEWFVPKNGTAVPKRVKFGRCSETKTTLSTTTTETTATTNHNS